MPNRYYWRPAMPRLICRKVFECSRWAADEFVQQVAAQLPWFHNCVLLDKIADRDERI
jgi:hypothetical protein